MADARVLKLRGAVVGTTAAPTTTTVRVTPGRRVQVGALASAARSAGAGAADASTVAVSTDELVRVEYDNGIKLWMRADDLLRERGQPTRQRGAGAAAAPLWDIDTTARTGVLNPGPATRGWVGTGIKVLEFFGVDLARDVAGATAEAFERRQLKLPPGQAPGLYRAPLRAGAALEPVTLPGTSDPKRTPPSVPLLVFLHGTMSSWRGSFGALEADGPGADDDAAREVRRALQQRYGEHIYTFEHLTLTQSPIRNALDLVNALPVGAELHLVSHSRGGLVGELLCLAERGRSGDPLATGLLEQLFDTDRTIGPQLGLLPLGAAQKDARNQAYAADLALLRQLLAALDAKRPKVRRFVRVACPARGTTLASGRLDRWLSVLDVLAGYTLFGEAADFLLAVVKQRTDPRTMPGVEAMLPGSALTRLLQLPGLATSADLSVIAGDVEGDSLWSQLKLLAADWFYGAEHDLVVNTGSMSGGLQRAPNPARWLEDRGPRVNHFRYFSNAASLRWLQAGLLRADDADGGFAPIATAVADEPRWRSAVQRSRESATPRPIVVVVPGTMGSALDAGTHPIWLHYLTLMRGGLADIGWDAAGVQAVSLLDNFYGPLLEHLAREHRVEVFPYDWRRSVRDGATALAALLETLVPVAEQTQRPLHIVAHSMGGLVSRAMIADGAAGSAVWQRMGRLPAGSRLLMLGTPNRGSYEAARWLTGANATLAKLSLLDLRHSVDGIIDIVRRYPGMAELLPFDDSSAADQALARASTWADLKRELDASFPLIDQAVLDAAAVSWTLLRKAPADTERMHYVAGSQRATVVGWQLPRDDGLPGPRALQWVATAEGDGTVSWASGRLDGVAMHYAEDTPHDELCSNSGDKRIFRGYVDLLASGSTDQLSTTAPQRGRETGEGATTFVLPLLPVADSMPDPAAVAAFAFSGRGPRATGTAVTAPPIEVAIRHGDLSYARHAVLVGHYEGDTIVSAEAVIDHQLGGALTSRRDLGLYPGARGSHAVFCNPDPAAAPSGAVVVGLGAVGDLAAGQLQASVRDAMLEYALRMAQDASSGATAGPPAGGGARVAARLSCLLVGSGGAGLAVRESVEAILRAALDANRRLADTHLDNRVLIAGIEFIELFEDVAIGAARAVAHALQADDIGEGMRWSPPILASGPGARERRYFDNDRSWDQRIEIVEDSEAGMLRFNVATNRARSEDTLSTGQLALADLFVAQASASVVTDDELSRTLFELLLPPTFKESAPDQRDMVLVVDDHSARFPWELLQDKRSRNGEPIAIESGVVRQLKTADFRLRPSQAMGEAALVIGNPDLAGSTAFADLPGARDEAAAVRDTLRKHYASDDVVALIGTPAAAIVAALHRRPWRVLHLAGHGEHEWRATPDTRPVSGMVIGNGVFLTPGDVEQMRCVPELVFINCCHLGKTETGAVAASARTVPFARLAANLGAQFVRMGVRAVVCAGWAVDDEAAATFASRFYAELLDGSPFRDAVKAARRDTRRRHPGVNTWGAYQCYGDPAWRLNRSGNPASTGGALDYVAPHELATDLCNLAEAARVRSQNSDIAPDALQTRQRADIDWLKQRAPAAVREAWLARADVAAALGFAYGEALLLEPAVAALEVALSAREGDCPVRAAEQSANFRVRLAAAEAAQLRAQPPTAAGPRRAQERAVAERIEAAIAELDVINRRAATPERLSLLGSASKRLAWVQSPGKERNHALLKMAGYYRDAFDQSGGDDAYALSNWGLACLLLQPLRPDLARGDWHAELARLVQGQSDRSTARLLADPDFYDAAGLADLVLVQLLLASDDDHAAQRLAGQAAARYSAALARGASLRDTGTVRDNLDFLIDMVRTPADGAAPWPPHIGTALAGLRRQF